MLYKILTFLLLVTQVLVAENKYTVIEDQAKIPLLNPEFKDRQTLKIILENGLQAYLISDPGTKQSAATLSVLTGSWSDPDEYPGIAHFLEHMLFLGTKKYPAESEYDRFLNEHGGQSNAFTGGDFTSYLFSVNNDGFEEALDRFSSFFTEPLFNPSGVSRELNAIDQEFAQNRNSQSRRELQVLKELGNPKHPFHRFDIGNSQTLIPVSQDTLKDWFQKHYSANLMRLFVYSALPMEKLKDLVVKDFSSIPNRNIEAASFRKTPLMNEDLYGKMLYIEPNQQVRNLGLLFELPEHFSKMPESRPDDILCYIMGHQGNESLLAQLKRENLATALSCGSTQMSDDALFFEIGIELTAEGLKDIDTVITRTFQAIHHLQNQPIPDYIFDDVQKIALIRYQNEPRVDPFELAMRHGIGLPRENLSTYPELTNTLKTKDAAAVKELLNYLTPEHAIFYLTAPFPSDFNLDKVEKWMQVPYTVKPISDERLQRFRSAKTLPAIDLPKENPFMPDDLSLVNKPDASLRDFLSLPKPKALIDNDSMLGYFAPDPIYQSPKVYWRFMIKSPEFKNGDPNSMVLADFYVKALEDLLDPISYDAKMAEIEFAVERKSEGIQITIISYSDSAYHFLEAIAPKIANMDISPEKFAVYKDSLAREYANFIKEQPLKQAVEYLRKFIYAEYVPTLKKSAIIEKIDLAQLKEFLNRFFLKTYTEALVIGNMQESDALKVLNQFQASLHSQPFPKSEQTPIKVISFSNDKGPYFFDVGTEALGNATLLTIEVDKFSMENRNAQQMLGQAIKESFFRELRTKQQTGYIVYSSAEDVERHLFSFFGVQSNSHHPRELLYRFEQFLEEYVQNIKTAEIPEERFELLKLWLDKELTEMPKNLSSLGDRFYILAFNYRDFNWIVDRVAALKKMTYSEFIGFAEDFLGRSNKRRLGILVEGQTSPESQFQYAPVPVLLP